MVNSRPQINELLYQQTSSKLPQFHEKIVSNSSSSLSKWERNTLGVSVAQLRATSHESNFSITISKDAYHQRRCYRRYNNTHSRKYFDIVYLLCDNGKRKNITSELQSFLALRAMISIMSFLHPKKQRIGIESINFVNQQHSNDGWSLYYNQK